MSQVQDFAADIMDGADKAVIGECSNCGKLSGLFGDNGQEIEECFCARCFVDEVWAWDISTECLREMIVESYVTNNVEEDVQAFRVDSCHAMKVWAASFMRVNG